MPQTSDDGDRSVTLDRAYLRRLQGLPADAPPSSSSDTRTSAVDDSAPLVKRFDADSAERVFQRRRQQVVTA